MLSAILSVIAFASAASAAPHAHAHVDSMARQLPSRWFHDDDHPVHALFRRDASGTPSFPPVGSPQWSAGFPKTASTQVPAAWTNALNAAVQAGTIPNIPVSTQSSPGANPSYGSLSPGKLPVCSSYAQCRLPGQIWDAPNNTIGISFDDGPLPPSDGLYTFLQQNNIPSTHFYIGTNILGQPKEFLFAFETLQSDIAVHTWTHPYMTTLSNAGVVAELGWTIQLIYNSTGGRLPRYWRPPYGDSDARVTAIAKEVFGLTTVIWNKDTADWSLGESSGTTQSAINSNFDKWLSGPKSPGLIILEHELMTSTVQAFMTNYPKFAQHGWQLESVAQLQGAAYQNAESSDSSVNPVGNVLAGGGNGTTLLLPTSSSAAPVSTVQAASGSASPSASPISASGQTSGALHKTRSVPLAVFFALAAFFARA